MNERIKQLWEDNDTIEVCYPEQGSPVSVSATTLEKFAELIVWECCQFENSYSGDARLVSRHYGRRIREHFGVEE